MQLKVLFVDRRTTKTVAVSATAVIGILVGFLVVGVIGVYVGDEILKAANLSSTDPLYTAQQTVVETFNLGVTLCKSINITHILITMLITLTSLGILSLGWGYRAENCDHRLHRGHRVRPAPADRTDSQDRRHPVLG